MKRIAIIIAIEQSKRVIQLFKRMVIPWQIKPYPFKKIQDPAGLKINVIKYVVRPLFSHSHDIQNPKTVKTDYF